MFLYSLVLKEKAVQETSLGCSRSHLTGTLIGYIGQKISKDWTAFAEAAILPRVQTWFLSTLNLNQKRNDFSNWASGNKDWRLVISRTMYCKEIVLSTTRLMLIIGCGTNLGCWLLRFSFSHISVLALSLRPFPTTYFTQCTKPVLGLHFMRYRQMFQSFPSSVSIAHGAIGS